MTSIADSVRPAARNNTTGRGVRAGFRGAKFSNIASTEALEVSGVAEEAELLYVEEDVVTYQYKFTVEDFNSHAPMQYVTSPQFKTGQHFVWTLQCYPRGTNQEGRLSVFLRCLTKKEVARQFHESPTISYRLIMTNQKNSSSVQKEISTAFKPGERGWGFQNYHTLQHLEDEGWLQSNQVMVGVRLMIPRRYVARDLEKEYGPPPYEYHQVPHATLLEVGEESISYTYEMIIPRYSTFHPQQCVHSEPFLTGTFLKWRLEAYPHGSDAKGYCSLFLSCDSYERAKRELAEYPRVKYHMQIRTREGDLLFSKPSDHEFDPKAAVWGFPKYCSADRMVEQSWIRNDELIIGVRVDVPKLYIPEYRSAIWAGKLKPSLHGVSRHLLEHYNQRMYADVELLSRDGEVFFAHRIVVAGESATLRESFEQSEQDAGAMPLDGSLLRVSLPQINYRTLEAVLRLMYGYELSLDYGTLFEVYQGLQYLKCEDLLNALTEYIQRRMKVVVDDYAMFRQLLDSEDAIILRQCFLALMATSKFYKRKQFLLLSAEEVKQFVAILREHPFEEREINFVVLCWVWHMQKSRGPVAPELAGGQTLEQIQLNVLEQVLHNDFYVMKNKVDVAFMTEQKVDVSLHALPSNTQSSTNVGQ